ncbi:GNAT family N-acetyltransferase [Rhizobium yanglingense]
MVQRLVRVEDEGDWKAYHSIRRRVFFELRGRNDYDPLHPDEYRDGHIPLLYKIDGNAVGTVRLDIAHDNGLAGTVRLVAVLPERQGKGVGAAMMLELEKLALRKGLRRLQVHAARDAVGFYQKQGWEMVDHHEQSPIMIKRIS